MTREQAEILALRALAWLLGDPDRAERFLTQSGCAPQTLLQQADDPALLGAVLDALLGDEESLIAFAADTDLDPALPAQARRRLPGTMTIMSD